ncbi:hypothetical protein ACLRDC_10465, partial [Gluconacetobacter sacchari]
VGLTDSMFMLPPVVLRPYSKPWGPFLRAFAETLDMREVAFADRPVDPFLNVNTPEDLEVARGIAEGEDAVLF